jgi:hypothetical protein
MGSSARRSKAPPRLLLLLHRHHHARLRHVKVSANSSKAEDPLPSGMTFENALEILGVVEGASFEEILRAKNNLLGKNSGDEELAIQVQTRNYIFVVGFFCFRDLQLEALCSFLLLSENRHFLMLLPA